MPLHKFPRPHAGVRVSVDAGFFARTTPEVVDWYDRVTGRAWSQSGEQDPRTHRFAFRAAYDRLPLDEDVVLASFGTGEGILLHDSELGEPAYALAPIGGRF